jgi:FkbM family methyltransferase
VSFEPLKEPFDKLMHRSGPDKDWICRKEALGDVNGTARIHVGNRSSISSMLAMHPSLAEVAPELGMLGQEDTAVARLDYLWEDLRISERNGNVYLKIDVQGFERQVLDGCAGVLDQVSAVEIELSLRELYEGQCLIDEALCRLRSYGFTCVYLEPSFVEHRMGHILQMDGIFLRLGKHGVPAEGDSQH